MITASESKTVPRKPRESGDNLVAPWRCEKCDEVVHVNRMHHAFLCDQYIKIKNFINHMRGFDAAQTI